MPWSVLRNTSVLLRKRRKMRSRKLFCERDADNARTENASRWLTLSGLRCVFPLSRVRPGYKSSIHWNLMLEYAAFITNIFTNIKINFKIWCYVLNEKENLIISLMLTCNQSGDLILICIYIYLISFRFDLISIIY